ncbi:MAG: radical SAM protein [Gemmatimonadota bacterium]|nr:radical SAM protein [Gemmatimonadota bacterium]
MSKPSYMILYESGELAGRVEALAELAGGSCSLCPHDCGADRSHESTGRCASGLEARVSGAFAHFGEEAPLVGRLGSGTIFFCGCNLRCSFCQNWEISQGRKHGTMLTEDALAGLMIELQRAGCHNINLVSPTHYIHTIVASLEIAASWGLCLPLVYNCGGYESIQVLEILDGVVDIYMPDTKFFEDSVAARFVSARDYATRAREAVSEMHRQVGVLQTGPEGIARRGLLIRHLVMPGGLAGTRQWMEWIARELSPESYVNVMSQYRPCYRAGETPEIDRPVTAEEFSEALSQATDAGLQRI